MTSLRFRLLLCSLLPLYFVVHSTNKQYIFINTSKGGPSTLASSEKPQIEIRVSCRSSGRSYMPTQTSSKYRGPTCLTPVAPRWTCVFLFLFSFFLLQAAWFIFTGHVYPKNAGCAVILGHPSVCPFSQREGGGCGHWPLAQTEIKLHIQLFMQHMMCNHLWWLHMITGWTGKFTGFHVVLTRKNELSLEQLRAVLFSCSYLNQTVVSANNMKKFYSLFWILKKFQWMNTLILNS